MADTTPGNLTFQLILGQQSEPVLAEVSGMSKESWLTQLQKFVCEQLQKCVCLRVRARMETEEATRAVCWWLSLCLGE